MKFVCHICILGKNCILSFKCLYVYCQFHKVSEEIYPLYILLQIKIDELLNNVWRISEIPKKCRKIIPIKFRKKINNIAIFYHSTLNKFRVVFWHQSWSLRKNLNCSLNYLQNDKFRPFSNRWNRFPAKVRQLPLRNPSSSWHNKLATKT